MMDESFSKTGQLGRMVACGLIVVYAAATPGADTSPTVRLPDEEIVAAYEASATKNVLAAVNEAIFPGYWSVCADGIGHGHGNTFPALDGHQMADALLFLGQVAVVQANWAYVRSFQRADGQLPFAILPASAGKALGPADHQVSVDQNGGLYTHWVPDNPLRALGYTTYIQNADVLYRITQDREWLKDNLPSLNLAGAYLASLTTEAGAVGGAGYYVERPTRVEYDGVTQGHASDAFLRLAALNALLGDKENSEHFAALSRRIQAHFQAAFWATDHVAEYIHPEKGAITSHGLTDSDWSAIATGVASESQQALLWPRLRDATGFRYGGMPTGIATHPERYEAWEFSHDDRMDLAAMGRVWYIESWARSRMDDGAGLVEALHQVCAEGRKEAYYWRERYGADGGFGVEKYCEYPANLIRIVQRFLMGVEFRLDGALSLAPTVPSAYWEVGFGQTLSWGNRSLDYRFQANGLSGTYRGDNALVLHLRLPGSGTSVITAAGMDGQVIDEGPWSVVTLAAPGDGTSGSFQVTKQE